MSGDDLTRVERVMPDFFSGVAAAREPAGLADTILTTTGQMRPRPRWLAFLKEPPMRISSDLAVGSPTARVVAALLLTLALALLATGAVVGASTLLAGPALIVVAQDGSGQATTIADAVAMAKDGDTVRVMPGTYPEHIVIDKDITLEGDPGSDRDAIVVTFTADSPQVDNPGWRSLPNAISLGGSDATVRHMRIEGPDHGFAVDAGGGDVLIEDLSIALAGEFMGSGRYGVFLHDGATGTLREVRCACSVGIIGGSSPTVERLTQKPVDPLIINGPGSDPQVRDSTLGKVWVQEGAHPSLTGNTISMEVSVGAAEVAEPPTVAELRDNVIDGAANDQPYGIQTLDGNLVLVGNTISGQVTGLDIGMGYTPTVQGNTFEGNATAINVNGGVDEVEDVLANVTGNTFCSNVTTLRYYGGSEHALADNEVCEADLATAP